MAATKAAMIATLEATYLSCCRVPRVQRGRLCHELRYPPLFVAWHQASEGRRAARENGREVKMGAKRGFPLNLRC